MYEELQFAYARTQPAHRYVALFLWLLVMGLFLSLARQWINVTSSDQQLAEYGASIIQRAAMERRSPADVKTLMVVKAQQLAIPQEAIAVTGEPGRLKTVIAYDSKITIPVIDRVLYRLQFKHNLIGSDAR